MKYFIEFSGGEFEYSSEIGLLDFCENNVMGNTDEVDRIWRVADDGTETDFSISWNASLEAI